MIRPSSGLAPALILAFAACAPAFERSPHYDAVTKHLDVGGQVFFYSDVDGDLAAGADFLDRSLARLKQAYPDVKLDRLNARRLLGQLGLDQVTALGLSSSREGKAFRNKAFFQYPRPRRGLLLMTDAPPHEMEILRQAPADTDLAFESDIRLRTFVNLVEAITNDLMGDAAKPIFAEMDAKLPMTAVSWRQLVDRLDTRMVAIARVDEKRSFHLPGDDKVTLPGLDALVAVDGLGILFDAYGDLLRTMPGVLPSSEGDMRWLELDPKVAGAPWLRPVLAKNDKTGRLFLATSKSFVNEYLADKTAGKNALAHTNDWKRAGARFFPKANGQSYMSSVLLTKLERVLRPLGKDDKSAQLGMDVIFDLLPEPGIPYATQMVNLDDGLYATSYATTSHKSTIFSAVALGPVATAGVVAAIATSGFKRALRGITGTTSESTTAKKSIEAPAETDTVKEPVPPRKPAKRARPAKPKTNLE